MTMAGDARLAAYFSHSWRSREVDLNVRVWEILSDACDLLVDVPEEAGPNPPYYINRIEELLRRTDLFVGVLAFRERKDGTSPPPSSSSPDLKLLCSHYSLFEIRLSQRRDLPLLVLYERSTGFRPPARSSPWEAYVPFDRGRKEVLPDQRQWTTVLQSKIELWKAWAEGHRKPLSYEQSQCAAILVDSSDPGLLEILEDGLRSNGYDPVRCEPARQTSGEALRLLREAGLIIADVGTREPVLQELYAAAHGIGVPAIRMLRSQSGAEELPWMLRGDPGGYQHDIVRWRQLAELPPLIIPRIGAMFRVSPALRGTGATDYLQSKRYSDFLVFISHTLKGAERRVVERIFELLGARHVAVFEYHEVNRPGEDWKEALGHSLQRTTHFVVLLSSDYEISPTCTYELEEILTREDRVKILPFLIGRDRPHPKLSDRHNKLLPGADPDADAQTVVDLIMVELDQALTQGESP